MRMIAGSLDATPGFLHAGYMSATRSGEAFNFKFREPYAGYEPVSITNLTTALALKTTPEKPAGAPAPTVGNPVPAAPGSIAVGDLGMLAGTLVFFALLAWVRWWPRCVAGSRGKCCTYLALVLIGTAGAGLWSRGQAQAREPAVPASQAPAWAQVPVQEYADPKAATRALLEAIIAEAVTKKTAVYHLSAIRDEVALPLKPTELTPGMAYALAAYGRDGWGHDFTVSATPKSTCIVRSNGADGKHGTDDDITMECPLATGPYVSGWRSRIPGLYVRCLTDGYRLLVHRVVHKEFTYYNQMAATDLTGSELFDILPSRALYPGSWQDDISNVNTKKQKAFETMLKKADVASQPEPLLYVRLRNRQQ